MCSSELRRFSIRRRAGTKSPSVVFPDLDTKFTKDFAV
jgi:hypothetical protein